MKVFRCPVSAAATLTTVLLLGACAGSPYGSLPPVSVPAPTQSGAVEVQPLDPAGSVQQRALGSGQDAVPRTQQASNPAVLALLDSASQQVASGDLERAASTLERALRIDPQDAGIWHDLGALRYQQGQYPQAESLAQRSSALATRNSALQARNWRLIEAVRRATGNAVGADEAAARALKLERQ